MLGRVSCFFLLFFLFSRLLIFPPQNQHISKNSFGSTVRASNNLDPDQARRFDGPDLGPNCLKRLLSYDTGKCRNS